MNAVYDIQPNLGSKVSGVVRLCGIAIPARKKVLVGLPLIYGIGKRNVFDVCLKVGVDVNARMYQLSEKQLSEIRKYLDDNFVLEGNLRGAISANIKKLVAIGCYRGLRHRKGLPVRGQRTKTNARTRKGRRKSPIAGKKKITK